MSSASNIILVLAALSTALMAGLFYSYSCSVNPGLVRLGDKEYLMAMQSINRAILNPAFFSAFIGSLVLLPLSAYLNYNPQSVRFWLLCVAACTYAIGLFGVTMFGNVPLNEMLDKFSISASSIEEITAMRKLFGTLEQLSFYQDNCCCFSTFISFDSLYFS
jgi:uncharacterized membrane protein